MLIRGGDVGVVGEDTEISPGVRRDGNIVGDCCGEVEKGESKGGVTGKLDNVAGGMNGGGGERSKSDIS